MKAGELLAEALERQGIKRATRSELKRMAAETRKRKLEHERDLKRRTRWGVFRWTPELGRVPNHELPKLAVGGREFRTERAAQKWIDRDGLVVRFWIIDEVE